MDKKEFANLKVGDKVRIVGKRSIGVGNWNHDGKMDKWLGKVMTVRYRDGNHIHMIEDHGERFFVYGWAWFDHMIAEKVDYVKEVKRKAKVGEWIKIVNAAFTGDCYKNGDILNVYKLCEFSSGWVYCKMNKKCYSYAHDNGNIVIREDEYVVLEGYDPEEKVKEKTEPKKETPKFKVGDKVKYLGSLELAATPVTPVTIVEHLIKDRKTIVKLSNGKVGVAVCSTEDEFDIYEGLRLASERAYGRAEAYKKPLPVKEVKRKAKVGEYIKVVNRTCIGEPYENGDIFKVKELIAYADSVRAECKGYGNVGCKGYHVIYDHEYVVLENYKHKKKGK